ncbi:hypothetical protein AVEN_168430-1 [Araneus ventricosus]|uniref:Uncharacterized protein n=1 Tax=Araneus ventricosus TaxID=182803 RepID=A0A4Y2JEM7_ARAVE|nr:hypothetical protein AVEN_168430-1 [Araneus ventricosus]
MLIRYRIASSVKDQFKLCYRVPSLCHRKRGLKKQWIAANKKKVAWKAIGRLKAGQTQFVVTAALGVPQSVISRQWNRFLKTGNVRRRSGQGRAHATTQNEDRYLTLTARINRSMNGTPSQQHLQAPEFRFKLFESDPINLVCMLTDLLVCVSLTVGHRAASGEFYQYEATGAKLT